MLGSTVLRVGCGVLLSLLLSLPVGAADKKKADEAKTKSVAPSAPVDINTATQKELESVTGIGAATAKKIIAGRPYSSIDDLTKAGLSAGTVAKLKPGLTVSAAPAAKAAAAPAKAAAAPAATAKAAPAPAATPAPGGGPGKVWVNKESKVFHRPGDRWYGTTKKGEYMSEADAIKAGYREAKEGAAKKR